jgi:hypothetical protein
MGGAVIRWLSSLLMEKGVSSLAARRHVWLARVIGAVITISTPAQAQLTLEQQLALAQQFRPYLKTTRDSDPEPARPCSWQWFFGRCNLYRLPPNYPFDPPILLHTATELAANPALILSVPGGDLRSSGGSDPRLVLELVNSDDAHGEPWKSVVEHGDGIYAHVEEVTAEIVNIEYTITWPFNFASFNDHTGDMTTLVVVYDRKCDLILRVSYLPHGGVNDTFRILAPDNLSLVKLDGLEADNRTPLSAPALRCDLAAHGPNEWQDGPWWHSPSDPTVFLVQDPATGRYCHPAVYIEHGAHEFWPNPTGSAVLAPKHTGDAFSFLPDSVQILGSLGRGNENPVHLPFLYYNGLFGDDPEAVVLHNTWYWQGERGRAYEIPPSRFTDRDPYAPQNGPFQWPPPAECDGQAVTLYVDQGNRQFFDGSRAEPFPDLTAAESMVPAMGTLRIAPGDYHGKYFFTRACRLVSAAGSARIGVR